MDPIRLVYDSGSMTKAISGGGDPKWTSGDSSTASNETTTPANPLGETDRSVVSAGSTSSTPLPTDPTAFAKSLTPGCSPGRRLTLDGLKPLSDRTAGAPTESLPSVPPRSLETELTALSPEMLRWVRLLAAVDPQVVEGAATSLLGAFGRGEARPFSEAQVALLTAFSRAPGDRQRRAGDLIVESFAT